MNSESKPWYREPMVWLVISIPAAAVIVGLSMLGYSIASYDGLVADDYYKQGKTINRRLERQARAAELGLSANLDFQPENSRILAVLSGNEKLAYPESIRLSFHHSTRASLDAHGELARISDSNYMSELQPLEKGKWYVVLETDDWKISRSIYWQGNRLSAVLASQQ